jgi:hypothetical protein
LISHFAPDWTAQFAPELSAHFAPESGAQFDRIFQFTIQLVKCKLPSTLYNSGSKIVKSTQNLATNKKPLRINFLSG